MTFQEWLAARSAEGNTIDITFGATETSLPTIERADEPPPVAPELPDSTLLFESRNKVVCELSGWVTQANERITKHKMEVDLWCRKQEEQKDAIVAGLDADIEKHKKALEDLVQKRQECKQKTSKAIQDVRNKLKSWLLSQRKEITKEEISAQSLQRIENKHLTLLHQKSDPPEELFCPITHEIMRNPVVTEDGHTYEQTAIVKFWTEKGVPISPITNLRLSSNRLAPNVALRSLCRLYRKTDSDGSG